MVAEAAPAVVIAAPPASSAAAAARESERFAFMELIAFHKGAVPATAPLSLPVGGRRGAEGRRRSRAWRPARWGVPSDRTELPDYRS
ncbi:hypothetical protein GCM10018781_77840 [Kitasatospora indigofera]|uniref:Uncharacterized protein n=1 Tax=Kitasatospora indigofera TaxID=67307 RepID=A0A918YVG4_9ACTN|nr:hypothetical protein GCM10018781_77840 [Kitasatospora indigofera]